MKSLTCLFFPYQTPPSIGIRNVFEYQGKSICESVISYLVLLRPKLNGRKVTRWEGCHQLGSKGVMSGSFSHERSVTVQAGESYAYCEGNKKFGLMRCATGVVKGLKGRLVWLKRWGYFGSLYFLMTFSTAAGFCSSGHMRELEFSQGGCLNACHIHPFV